MAMTTLLGWLGSVVEEGARDAVLAAMTAAHAFGNSNSRDSRTGPATALSVSGGAQECSLSSDGLVWAAIIGHPRWEHPELAALAMRSGHAAALIDAYRRHEEGFLQYLRGPFALAVMDGLASRVLLAIDRFGIGTLCYSQPVSGGLVFGSSADVLRAHPAVHGTVTPQSVFNYLYLGICPSPQTIYREQFKLLPAQYAVYEKGALRTAFYWCMPYREHNARTVANLAQEMMERLRAAVERAIGDTDRTTLGAFLSGGLDSSTVVGLLSEATGKRAKSFTIGFSHDKYDEVHYADIAARHFGVESYKHYLTPHEVAAVLGDVSRAFDEPFGNSSVLPAYYCARMAREQDVKLMLAGDGGDEIFAGNSRYADQGIFEFYGRLPLALRRRFIEPIVLGFPGFGEWPIGRRAQSYLRQSLIPLPDRLQSGNFYKTVELSQVFESDALAAIDPEEPLANCREAYERAASTSPLQRMLHLDLKITLADNDLRKVETACDMTGMSVAYPFLDDDVVEFSAQIPSDLLMRHGKLRWFYRQAVKGFLAPETLAKRKHGFGMPYAEWPRENPELREIASDCLNGFKRRHYLRADFLDRMLTEGDAATYGALVWDVMMLELWFREREAKARDARRSRSVA
jgi:asparagine synthase (glutamine-hydrolysing)